MDKTEGNERPEERGRQPERRGPQKPRGDSGGSRPPQEPRRRRGGDHRYASWGDQLLHSFCANALHELPPAFPVEHHQGAATIPRAIVARRDGEVLFCSYSHCGPHAWPDGEEVSETPTDEAPRADDLVPVNS